MYGFCDVWLCVCIGFEYMVVCNYGFFNVCVLMYGFCNVRVCVCMDILMCGCVYICVL